MKNFRKYDQTVVKSSTFYFSKQIELAVRKRIDYFYRARYLKFLDDESKTRFIR